MNHDYNVLVSQKQYLQKQLPVSACRSTSLLASHLLLLPWCMAIAGYGISSDNSNSQQQPIVGYKQTSKLLPGASLATRVKTTMNTIPNTNTVPTIRCTSNNFICGYCIGGIHFCLLTNEALRQVSCETYHNSSECYSYTICQ